jgi:hypothetical protein
VVPVKSALPFSVDWPAEARGPDSRVYVIFTDAPETRTVLSAAASLAHGLDLPLEVLAAQIVPYPLPLDAPPVAVDFAEQAMTRLVAGLDAQVAVRILLCRDADETLRKAVGPDALVVIGGGNPKLARLLASDRRRVIVIR